MGDSDFHLQPSDLHASGSKLSSFGEQLVSGGQKMESTGQHLVSHASADKSGVGSVVVKALGKGMGIAGKVFSEGGRVTGAAGSRLHGNATAHETNEAHQTSAFRSIQSDSEGGPTKPSSTSSTSSGTHTPSDDGAGSSGGHGPTKPSGTGEDSTPPSSSGGGAGSGKGSGAGDENADPKPNATPTGERPTGGDPVDLTTGRMMLTQVDARVAGSLPLLVSRTHLSSYRIGRSFGPSWASTVDQRLEVDERGVHFVVGDGTLLTYPLPVDGAVLPVEGPRWPLARTDEGGYVVAEPDSSQVWHFAATGDPVLPITAICDGQGQRIDIDRDAAGVPVRLRHSAGPRIEVATSAGLITSLRLFDSADTADAGRGIELMSYRYDEHRRLVEVVNSSARPLRFEYDEPGRIVRWEDRNGMWYRYAYDARNRCVRTQGADGYLDCTFAYDTENRITTATNSLGHSTTYQLDENYRVIAATDPLGNTTSSSWDRYGRLLSRTDPLGRAVRHTYDAAGNVTSVTRADGSQTVMSYDPHGRLVSAVEPDGAVWRREYHDNGLLAAVIDPAGARTGYTYDERGHLATLTDAAGNTTLARATGSGLPISITDPLGATTSYVYDVFGRPATVTDPLGNTTRLSWTVEGKPLRQVQPDGMVERWSYDGEGNVRETIDPQGNVSRIETAHFDLPVLEVKPDGGRLAYSYDTELRLTSVTNEQGLTWRYTYDQSGQPVQETDFNGRVVRYEYDAAGQLVRQTNALGQDVRIDYDVLGRMVRRQSGDAVATFAYDPVGRMLRARNADAEVTLSYDPLGRMLTETVNGRTVSSAYDVLGLRTRRRTPSGAESEWEYDAASRPVALHAAGHTVRFDYDPAGHEVERRIGAGVRLAQSWDANSRLTSQTVLAGRFDPAALASPATTAQTTVVQRRTYDYQPGGQLTAVNDQLAGSRRYDLDPLGRVTAVHGAGWAERYAYDLAGNVVDAGWPTGPNGPTAPESDAVGQREYAGTLVRRAGSVRYEHDAEGRIVLRQRKTLSARPENWHYTWDADNRLVAVTTPDGQTWRYRYDPFGRRIAKQRIAPGQGRAAEQVEFTWDGVELVEQVHNGGRATVWDWEPGSYRAVSQTERVPVRDAPQQWVDERFFAIVTDLVGTPTELVAPDGTLAWRAQATLWGVSTVPPGNAPDTPLRFPGQYHDPETGLHYNYQRYYDPTTGRYASLDPLGLAPSPNPQAYVSNPTGWIDPMGLAPTAGCVPTTTAYRVEGPPLLDSNGNVVKGKEGNQLLDIDQHGNVTIPQDKMLYVNFGSADRANEYLDKRVQQNFHGIQIKSFQVPTSYVDNLRNTAVMENKIKTDDPGKLRPVVADPTKAPDQFGIRPHLLDDLRNNIIPGSGVVHTGHA